MGLVARILRRVFRRVPVDGADLPFTASYDRVFEALTPRELQLDPEPLTEDDLQADLWEGARRNRHFLGFYTEHGADLAFERYGFWDLLREKGFEPVLKGDLSDPDEHRLRIYDREPVPSRLLVELVVGLRDLVLPDGTTTRMLFINWLTMQDPTVRLEDSGRPALPGQKHPGLGLFPELAYLLRLMGLRLRCDGLMNHPQRYHNAVLYGRFMKFVDPAVEGRFRALERDLAGLSLPEASLAVSEGRVVGPDGTPFVWDPADQVLPITRRARAWFEGRTWRRRAQETREGTHFRVTPPS
ncbi:MAG: hypothetical protein H6736_18605 [Alphaproteobacteria bacterium]|nr:hypothetical protein [Alphaproteobacteria bacterium]MCB9693828.1 hypothetical protein [Alphaproteobacteria bacterium]